MLIDAADEADFVGNALGPALSAAGPRTKIVIWDHNYDHPEYLLAILKDQTASRFISGTAFDLYAGDSTTMSTIHKAFPNKAVYFTEQMVVEDRHGGVRPIAEPFHMIVIDALRNWSQTVLLWNLASDLNKWTSH